jgi:streptogramin lyase/mono/diheme cytochrome c family protein
MHEEGMMKLIWGTLAGVLAAALLGLTSTIFVPQQVHGAESGALLTGSAKSAAGEKMGGVTVSAKAEGSSITTSVFSDAQGNYYFPRMPAGRYRVWAQADSYDIARATVDLAATQRQDFVLKPMADYVRQLTGDQLLASLPEDTPDDRRMKRVFRNNCTGCHQPNYILQNRFDEEGWMAILNLMRDVNVTGAYQGEDAPVSPQIEYHEQELAAYLARMRGPGPSAMKIKVRPRPTGDAARVVFTEYDIPLDPTLNYPTKYVTNNGSDWSLGTPSSLNGANGVHDAQADLYGNIWFSYAQPSEDITIGRVDARTGDVKFFKVEGMHGMAARSHGITRDAHGNLWFNISPGPNGGPAGLGEVDPSTQEVQTFYPPKGMTGTAGTLDTDGKGNVWVTTNIGALRFDPTTKQFKEFKSPTFIDADGVGTTYGLAADADGNAWWAEMSIDIVGKSDIETGKSLQVKLPPVPSQLNNVTPEERKLYADSGSEWNNAVPWAQGPRRLGADKNGDVVWVCDYWGGNLARININTLKVKIVPLPQPDAQQPYQAMVDRQHNVWMNLMNADAVLKYDPKTSQWTEYPFPTLGTETRYISLLERNGSMQVILPYWRTRKVARITFRTKKEMEALKNQVEQHEQAAMQ